MLSYCGYKSLVGYSIEVRSDGDLALVLDYFVFLNGRVVQNGCTDVSGTLRLVAIANWVDRFLDA